MDTFFERVPSFESIKFQMSKTILKDIVSNIFYCSFQSQIKCKKQYAKKMSTESTTFRIIFQRTGH